MPNYEYLCRQCSHRWEDIQTIANRDRPTTLPCPQCSAEAVERGWDSAPTMGVDSNVKPQGAFRERMDAMRDKLGRYNPRVRNNIDRALSHKGTKSGPQ